MDEKQFLHMITLLGSMAQEIHNINNQLRAIAQAQATTAPNYRRSLAAYRLFDFASIGATVTDRDADGPTIVEWMGHTWKRRSPQNKFNTAIWFSRADGQDENGTVYHRLITFADDEPVTQLPPTSAPMPAQAQPQAQPKTQPPTPELFSFRYGNGETAEKTEEQTAFNAYRRAHNETAPPNRQALRTWYARAKATA